MAFSREILIEGVHSDWTPCDIDDLAARTHCEEADIKLAAGAGLLKVWGDLGAVVPCLGRRDKFLHGIIDISHMPEKLTDLVALPSQLGLIAEVLILATTTGREQWAVRFLPVRAGFYDIEQVAMGTTGFVLPDPGLDTLSRQAKGNEDNPPIDASHP